MRCGKRLALGLLALSAHALAAEPADTGAASTPLPAGASSAETPPASPAPEPAQAPAPAPSATAATAPSPAAAPASPAPPATTEPQGDLQSPEQVDTRYSAYSLPRKTWAFDVGALGVGGGDVFARLGAAYGIGGGLQVEMNLAHVGVGLLNATVGWHFIDTRYFDLGARAGLWYGHGSWFWIAPPATRHLVSKIDALSVPLEVTASSTLTRWLELDLSAHYGYATVYGSSANTDSVFVKAELALSQFYVRPTARLFISDNTEFVVSAKLPVHSAVPFERGTVTLPFSDTWGAETGLRSRLAPRLFGNLRLHYGPVSRVLYGARVYPSFDIEFRL